MTRQAPAEVLGMKGIHAGRAGKLAHARSAPTQPRARPGLAASCRPMAPIARPQPPRRRVAAATAAARPGQGRPRAATHGRPTTTLAALRLKTAEADAAATTAPPAAQAADAPSQGLPAVLLALLALAADAAPDATALTEQEASVEQPRPASPGVSMSPKAGGPLLARLRAVGAKFKASFALRGHGMAFACLGGCAAGVKGEDDEADGTDSGSLSSAPCAGVGGDAASESEASAADVVVSVLPGRRQLALKALSSLLSRRSLLAADTGAAAASA